MKLNDYVQWTSRTRSNLGSEELNNIHMVMGMSTEVGELFENLFNLEKMESDDINTKEELGDIMWYLAGFCNINKLNLEEIVRETPKYDFLPMNMLVVSVGELMDILKKNLAYGKTIDWTQVWAIIPYIFYSIVDFCIVNGFDLNKIIETNVAKLEARYPEKFTKESALNRDLDKERVILEQ